MGELATDPNIDITPPAPPASAPPMDDEQPPMEPHDGPPFEAYDAPPLGDVAPQQSPTANRLVEKDPIRAALALLLFHPSLASALKSWDDLRTIGSVEGELLVEMLDLLQIDPDATTYHLIGRWVGTRKDRYAKQLLSFENLLTEENARQEFLGAISRIRSASQRQQLEQELAELTRASPSALSAEQKTRILELMGTLKTNTH